MSIQHIPCVKSGYRAICDCKSIRIRFVLEVRDFAVFFDIGLVRVTLGFHSHKGLASSLADIASLTVIPRFSRSLHVAYLIEHLLLFFFPSSFCCRGFGGVSSV